MARPRLTPTQRQILLLAQEHGRIKFGRGQRQGLWHAPAIGGGEIISAYGTPEWFLKHRGLIESQAPGSGWYVLTAAGEAAIAPRVKASSKD